MKNNTAFPAARLRLDGEDGCGMYAFSEGMELRDYFAAKAMQAIVSKTDALLINVDDDAKEYEAVALGAYAYADAMLKARNK